MTQTSRTIPDYRPLLFCDSPWFSDLSEDSRDLWVAWRVTTSSEQAWWKDLLSAAAAFAKAHDLLPMYRKRFAGIPRTALLDSSETTRHRSASFPIWEIANELVVALYLERALGWDYLDHEPPGHQGRVGDWQFRTPSGSIAFIEVKSLAEPERAPAGVYSKGIASQRLVAVLKGAYRQIPKDGRSTLVVVVGHGSLLDIGFGIMHGDLFQTMFGQMQISFSLSDPDGTVKLAPSFYDMFTQPKKNRRLGCVAGLRIGGLDYPGLAFHAIHNPFAVPGARLTRADFELTRQFSVDEAGRGEEIGHLAPSMHWQRILDSFTILT